MTAPFQLLGQWIGAANAANASGQFDTAVGLCRQALKVAPNLPEAWYNLAIAHRGRGRRADALDALKKTATLTRDSADAQNSIGLEFLELAAFPEAKRAFERAIALAPGYPFPHSNLGKLLERQKRYKEAEAAFRTALRLQPDLAPAHANLCGILNAQKHYVAGEAAGRRAVELAPAAPVAWSNLASSLIGCKRFADAETACRKALDLDRNSPEAWGNLGQSLAEQFRLDEAEAAYTTALALDPAMASLHSGLAKVFLEKGNVAQAAEELGKALAKDPDDPEILAHQLFCLNYLPDRPPAEMTAIARRYGDVLRAGVTAFDAWRCDPDPARKLRIGLVSGDLRRHPVGYLLRGPLREIARSEFELFAYSNFPQEDDLSAELRQHCAAWAVVNERSDAELARQIHDDRIDILLDLSGHTDFSRVAVFARRPAPVQASWVGYYATTGVREIDWKIGDPWVTPDDEAGHFTERLWRLPDSCFCFAPPEGAPAVTPLPSERNGYVTYGCFNNLAKVNDAVIETWSRILHASPDARLLLKARQLGTDELRAALLARFAAFGIGPERLDLEAAGSYAEYLDTYARIDLALDPFPFAGATTTAESLWMGVPVVTLRGDRFIAHQGESLMHAAGLGEMIAANRDAYVQLAVDAAADRQALAALRAGLRERVAASPLFDAARYARNLETAWRGMWTAWCERGEKPATR
ncbi:tetratricopeptide repeat protein [Dechloromonas sp. H13]|uniref:O-linked N-acetylglucosamine transferase, SPINDLY family protein n=1 Tax=Dechloromonas sp. H13 TaxID=2570193 RepID=UPI001291E9B4|nr:tetratricopeptide repeat protein [Dechloromonas sp. H13]